MIDFSQKNKKHLNLLLTGLFISLIVFNCSEKSSQLSEEPISTSDIMQINQINRNYSQGWLENDSAKVLGLFSDSATIIPSGLMPITGRRSIKEFWFPDDGSKTLILKYDLEILEIHGSANLAYSYEHGNLSFTYEKGDFKMQRDSESYAITVYKKNNLGNWKIVKRIWSDLKP
ncbi:MAG: hypothetical protein D8M58_16530 [Calditrichaeota bacterium]|nr:MAG: hypothetical protein DWQ03_08260 [Calditrichota bacterium]MBL1207012.1 hypothetical protein [Calditrichota bacterium]NOG46839.1 hypothetical protein [Calditrichota bacterium]